MLHMVEAAGWPIWPLILCSIVALAVIFERLASLRRARILPPKLLKLGVPVVTAFHIVRLAVVVTTAAPGFRLLRRLAPSSPP